MNSSLATNYTACALLHGSQLPKLNMTDYCITIAASNKTAAILKTCTGSSDIMNFYNATNHGCYIYAHFNGSTENAYDCLDNQQKNTIYSHCVVSAAPSIKGGKTVAILGAMLVAAVMGGAI